MDFGVTGKLGGYYLAEQAAKKKAWELPRKHWMYWETRPRCTALDFPM